MSLQRGINLRALAEKMGQCSGAEVRGICTEAGMYALRERRQHVTQEDFEFAVAKVGTPFDVWTLAHGCIGSEEEPRRKYVCQQAFLVVHGGCMDTISYVHVRLLRIGPDIACKPSKRPRRYNL